MRSVSSNGFSIGWTGLILAFLAGAGTVLLVSREGAGPGRNPMSTTGRAFFEDAGATGEALEILKNESTRVVGRAADMETFVQHTCRTPVVSVDGPGWSLEREVHHRPQNAYVNPEGAGGFAVRADLHPGVYQVLASYFADLHTRSPDILEVSAGQSRSELVCAGRMNVGFEVCHTTLQLSESSERVEFRMREHGFSLPTAVREIVLFREGSAKPKTAPIALNGRSKRNGIVFLGRGGVEWKIPPTLAGATLLFAATRLLVDSGEFSVVVETGDETLLAQNLESGRNWTRFKLQLPEGSGEKTLRIRLDSSSPDSLLALSDAKALRAQPAAAGRPNIILISLDTMAAGRMSLYGYGQETTPFLTQLAETSVVFDQAHSQSGYTLPSHTTMLTGLYPDVHRVTPETRDERMPFLPSRTIPESLPMIQERLRAGGYLTVAVTEGGYVSSDFGFDRGFDEYFEDPGVRGDKTFEQARAFLRERHFRPFFLFLHTYAAHEPHVAPPKYFNRFMPDEAITPFFEEYREDDTKVFRRIKYQGFKPPQSDRELLIRQYEAQIRWVDDLVKGLFDTLKETELKENTIVVVTSDHGQGFWEHGSLGHNSTLYQEVVHVPLLFHFPKGIWPSRRVGDTVQVADIPSTLLELAGEEPMRPSNGVSLVPALLGDPLPERAIWAMEHNRRVHLTSVRRGEWKYVKIAGRYFQSPDLGAEEVYKLDEDPKETPNQLSKVDVYASPIRALHEAMAAEHARLGDLLQAGHSVVEGDADVSRETEEALRALGYID